MGAFIMKGDSSYHAQCLHAVVSSDASQDRQPLHETAEDKLIIYQHYATDYHRGVTMQTQKSTLTFVDWHKKALMLFQWCFPIYL